MGKYKVGVLISGLVTFIAAYHYMRIFNSWVESYEYTKEGGPFLTGVPFNDAYRYMDWLLTVPLLLMEIVLVMKVPDDEKTSLCTKLGVSSGLMIIMGYPGELLTEQDELAGRWKFWCLSMIPFCYVVYTLLVGIQVGYCISDIISKCGVGLFIYQISLAKSEAAMAAGFSPAQLQDPTAA